MFTSSERNFTGNDVTDDVIITKTNKVYPYSPRNNPVKFHQNRIRFSRDTVFTSSKRNFTGNDVTDVVIVTKINRVLPYPLRNNPVKFHQNRIRFSRVTVFTSSKCNFTGNDELMFICLVFMVYYYLLGGVGP